MPTACDTISKNSPDSTTTDANNGNATVAQSDVTSSLPSQDSNVNGGDSAVNGQNGGNQAANGFTDEDVDYEMPVKQQSVESSLHLSTTNGKVADGAEATDGDLQGDESSFVFIQDNGFNIKISPPGVEAFDLQVSPLELVQEINHLLIDREDTCHRTCFSLQLDGNTLDNFTELKNVEGLKEGSVIKVVEEPYTVREARIHVRHVRDLIKSLDMSDAFNGLDCISLSFMNIIAQNDQFDQNKNKIGKVSSVRSDMLDCLPPDYVLPPGGTSATSSSANNGNTNGNVNNNLNNNNTSHNNVSNSEIQLVPLEPQSKDQLKTPACIKVLTASGWNPPPGSRKLRGDLMYLYVVTLEEKRFHITSSSRGFYVNQSTDEVFNPKPANPKVMFHSLVDLLSHISSAFKRNFVQIQKRRHQRHPFERLVTPYQVYAWTAPQLDHTVDSIRAEDAFSSKLGYEEHMPGQTRDWNEELQTTRELPRKTLAERIIRERAVFKVHSDFISAATRGAMAVVDGNVMALNPSEDTKMQMFIWNSIFFSLGFDVRDHYKDLGGDAAAFAAPCNDLHGVRAYSAIDIEGLYTLATAVIDYKGYRVTAQSIIPGILERDQEQSVVHGSIDFGKTVVTNPKYLDLLNKAGQMLKIVPHKVISKNNEEVEICSSVECKGIIGNDGRHYILDLLRTFPPDPNYVSTDGEELSKEMKAFGFPRQHKHKLCSLRQELVEAFFEARYVLFIKLAAFYLQQSDLKKKSSTAQDAGGDTAQVKDEINDIKSIESASQSIKTDKSQIKLEELVDKETSAIIDEAILKKDKVPENIKKIFESYAAASGTPSTAGTTVEPTTESAPVSESLPTEDNALATVADSTVADAADSTLSSADLENTRQIIRKVAADIGSLNDTEFDIRFNPDIFSLGVTHFEADSDVFKKQKQLIKDAAEFLVKVQLPSLIRDSLEHSIYLYDGITLTDALHSRGINIRYLGKFADLVSKHKTLDYLMTIVVSELVCRSAKHLFANYIQGVEVVYLSTAISHFLNCLLSTTVSQPSALINDELSKHSKRKSKKNKKGGNSDSKLERLNFDWLTLTSKSLWSSLRHEMDSYYGWSPAKDIDSVDSLLASYSIQKISLLRIVSIRFGVQVLLREYNFDHKSRPAFTEDDIMNVFPIVKHISPRATDAYNFLQTGQRKIQDGNLREGYDYITEALNLFNNVYGPLHSDIVQCLRLLSRINYVLTDYQEACSFQQKAVLMSEKVNGIDHPHTITEYNFLALYSFANSQISASLKFLYRARYLLTLVHSQNHPEIAIIDSNIGLILHAIGEYDYSLHFLEHAVKLNLRYFGRRNLKVALSYHLVARTLSCMGDFRGALNNEKETYMIYKKELGETHDKTKESSDCLRHLTNQAVVLQKKMNEIYKGNANAIIPPIQIQPPSISSVLELLNVINGILFVHISSEDVENLKTVSANSADASAANLIKNGSDEDGKVNGGTSAAAIETASIEEDVGAKVMTASA